ncbi:hypothetical protein [Arhodomonas sp. SL1]|uniref:hypothetical protein n=1 Tax=Arhodomonas sp. SL1 TaxID=3425691 RepID=UPI003F880D75
MRWILGFALAALLTSPAGGAGPSYSVTELGGIGGLSRSVVARDVNDHGQVVGDIRARLGDRGFLWDPDNGWVGIGDERTPTSTAQGLNNAASVVGGSRFGRAFDPDHAFLWTQAEGMSGLSGLLPRESGFSRARDINNHGMVVGSYYAEDGERAFRWSPSEGLGGLGDGVDGMPGRAFAINDAGTVAGTVHGDTRSRAFVWTDTAGARFAPDGESVAYGIGPSGRVVGAIIADGHREAMRWDPSTGVRGLGQLVAGAGFSEARDINGDGVIVGRAVGREGMTAFVWTEARGIRPLEALVEPVDDGQDPLRLFSAVAISEAGHIAAYGRYAGERALRSFLLQPRGAARSQDSSGDGAGALQ